MEPARRVASFGKNAKRLAIAGKRSLKPTFLPREEKENIFSTEMETSAMITKMSA